MPIYAIADLHLSFGVPNKEMDVFGEKWVKHHQKIEKNWREIIKEDDLVLIAGDISWALHMEDALVDLQWIDSLPGTKVMIKGNHDLWWKSKAKVTKVLPKSIHLVQNNAFTWKDITIAGTRLWENEAISYSAYIDFRPTPLANVHEKPNTDEEKKHDKKIFASEIDRLITSLDSMDKSAKYRIVMLHYPPSGPAHEETEVTKLLEKYHIDTCLYGHLHNLKESAPTDFTLNGIQYYCTACDFLNFHPLKLSLEKCKN